MNRRQFVAGLVAALLAGTTGGLLSGGTERRPSPSDLFNRLSPREREVLALRARGWSNAQIGRELLLSPFTVSVFVQNGLEKLKMQSRLEAATLRQGRSTAG
jgi:two-component system nitrate/nitrite response regulator NarL